MDRIDPESFRLGCPLCADEFVKRRTLQSLESAAEVVGVDKIGQILAQLRAIVAMEAFDSGFLNGPIHPLDLPVGRQTFELLHAMSDAVLLA
jgi:hypothetical protein